MTSDSRRREPGPVNTDVMDKTGVMSLEEDEDQVTSAAKSSGRM